MSKDRISFIRGLTLFLAGQLFFTDLQGNPAQTKKLYLAWDAAPRTADPRFAVDANSQYLEDLIHCSLVSFNPQGKVTPRLASSWTWSQGGTTLTFNLKDEVSFHDGTLLAAEDVVTTFSSFSDPKSTSPRSGSFKIIENIEAPDKKTVVFHLKEMDATFLTNLSVGILPKSSATNNQLNFSEVVGCGPFKFKSKSTSQLVLEKNNQYSVGSQPKIEQVVIKIVKDESTRFAKLRKGEVHIVQNNLSRDKLKQIGKKYPNLKILKKPGLNTTYLGFNMRHPILKDPKVRRAISLAIDRESIINFVLAGYAVPANTLIPPDNPYYDRSLEKIEPKLAEAKKLLDQAGFKDPDGEGPKPRFKLTYKTTTNLTRVTIGKAIGSYLNKVGIAVNVQPLEWGRFKSDVEKGRVDLWSLSWIGYKDPDIFRYAFATESFPPNGGNRGRYSNAKLDKVLAEARTASDEEDRKKLYKEVQRIVNNELPYVFLWHEDVVAVTQKSVEGFELYADGRLSSLTRTQLKDE